ncbi:hypothetical protein GCK72_002746 [Caenorhabditis remanei]|uniref:Secreted protein n=1 Tax=Caenorhabditis remanei TaxID=31234 RepID=A0A6A5HXW3_CAERE|nr:hypothetical protein GCK72_002746 [Caenorhabditis remanei]KAF1770922.1 hypothetical protein GCK72_002746 [Caenorhabditis remanei]
MSPQTVAAAVVVGIRTAAAVVAGPIASAPVPMVSAFGVRGRTPVDVSRTFASVITNTTSISLPVAAGFVVTDSTMRSQVPRGSSPHCWTERNGHLWNPLALKSCGRGGRRTDRVPDGENRVHICCSGTVFHVFAIFTSAPPSMSPYPNLLLTILPTPFLDHPGLFSSGFQLAVRRTRCCISLHVNSGFASRARAIIPAARGADADVPVCLSVHPPGTSTVTIAG